MTGALRAGDDAERVGDGGVTGVVFGDGLGFEIDHVFVAVRQGAPELAALVRAGFAEGAPNVHVGQGTACRRVFFENAYLEFLWLEDVAEASVSPVDRTGLAERTRCVNGVSRLGVALRSRPGAGSLKGPAHRRAEDCQPHRSERRGIGAPCPRCDV